MAANTSRADSSQGRSTLDESQQREPAWGDGGRIAITAICLFAAAVVVAYWSIWFTDRSLLASSSTQSYVDFENAFPLADGWLAVCLLATAASCLLRRGSAAYWLLASGAAGMYLFGMDALYDIEHGIWTGGGAGGAVEAVINALTLAMSALFLLMSRKALRSPR